MQFIKPEESDLHALFEEATDDQTPEEFTDNFTSSVVELLKNNPAHYRAYGPWWWQVKQAVIAADKSIFEDDTLDASWLEMTTYDRPEFALCAAWAYAESQHDRGAQTDNTHIVETEEGMSEYVLVDNELEVRTGI